MSLDPKKAVEKAKAALLELYGDISLEALVLEEVSPGDDERTWEVTLGFIHPSLTWLVPGEGEKPMGALDVLRGIRAFESRVLKTVVIDAEDGRVLGMKDKRLLATAG